MLVILALFFIGKAFFNLAKKHQRNKWLFAVLGVAVCYGMIIIGGIVIALIAVALGNDGILDAPDAALGLMGVPVGLLSVWLFHYLLRKNWEGNPKDTHPDLLDSSDF